MKKKARIAIVLLLGIILLVAIPLGISNIEASAETHTWAFCSSGFFPKHLSDSYYESVQLGDLADVPSDVQGVYWYDCATLQWKFWAPGAPGCTLPTLGGGHTYDYMVAVTGACEWEISLSLLIPTLTPTPTPTLTPTHTSIPEITFRRYSGVVIWSPTYGEEGEEGYSHFEVTRGSGDVEITVEINGRWSAPSPLATKTASFYLEEGIYRLAIVVVGARGCSAWEHPCLDEIEFVVSSPSALADGITKIGGLKVIPSFVRILTMTVEPWAPPTPTVT